MSDRRGRPLALRVAEVQQRKNLDHLLFMTHAWGCNFCEDSGLCYEEAKYCLTCGRPIEKLLIYDEATRTMLH